MWICNDYRKVYKCMGRLTERGSRVGSVNRTECAYLLCRRVDAVAQSEQFRAQLVSIA